jgi:hypothetical protein
LPSSTKDIMARLPVPQAVPADVFRKRLEYVRISQSDFARILGVYDRTVRKWLATDGAPAYAGVVLGLIEKFYTDLEDDQAEQVLTRVMRAQFERFWSDNQATITIMRATAKAIEEGQEERQRKLK